MSTPVIHLSRRALALINGATSDSGGNKAACTGVTHPEGELFTSGFMNRFLVRGVVGAPWVTCPACCVLMDAALEARDDSKNEE